VAFLLVLVSVLLVILWLVGAPLYAVHRRRRIRDRPFPAAWRAILRRRVPYYRFLPSPLQAKLKGLVQVFIAEKDFIGCDGVAVDDEMRVTIAAQACLLLLNRPGAPFPKLRQILIYPGAFLVERLRLEPSGVLQDQRSALSGESWAQGQVVLSWADTVEGASAPADGRNVVLHEFAHQLDQEKGFANGAPHLGSREAYRRWSQVMAGEFARLQAEAFHQAPTLLNFYGASDPAEFFAVATEAFFEQPRELALERPALYAELANYYRVDPAGWVS